MVVPHEVSGSEVPLIVIKGQSGPFNSLALGSAVVAALAAVLAFRLCMLKLFKKGAAGPGYCRGYCSLLVDDFQTWITTLFNQTFLR